MLATAGADELHVTVLVRSCVLLSVYVPIAVNCCVVPLAMEGLPGVTPTDTSVATSTVRVAALPVTLPKAAWMVVDPVPSDWASPVAPIVATAGVNVLHVTVLVMFWVLLSV